MKNLTKVAVMLPALALVGFMTPSSAEARTKDVLKYGAIGLGAAALYNMGQQSAYSQPYYGGGYYAPSYSYGYSYSQPSYYYPSNYSYGYSSYPSYSYGGYYYGY